MKVWSHPLTWKKSGWSWLDSPTQQVTLSAQQGGSMGTLEQRYNIYVQAMVSMGREYKTFDEWLDS